MNLFKKTMLLAVVLVGMVSLPAYGEFYQYTDTNGVQRFTDDLASVPPDQRPEVKTHQSIKSDPVQQPAANAPVVGKGAGETAPPSGVTTPQTGTWNEKIASQAEELDRKQMELNKAYFSLQAERDAMEAKKPSVGASAEEREAYRQQVKQLNAKIKDYESQYADFREMEKAFNKQYNK